MNELSAVIQQLRIELTDGIKDAAVDAAGVAVDNSPKFSGQLRASTRIGIGSPDLEKVIAPVYRRDAIAAPESRSKGTFASAIAGFRLGNTIYISNDLDYAANQEYEAGHLMFSKAARRFEYLLDGVFSAT